MRHLDLSAIEAFVLVADLRSFTLAAEALDLTQAGVSLKVRRLETSLGRQLLTRSPRQVRLSPDGQAFLPKARELLKAQENAFTPANVPRMLMIGISDHVAGPELPTILEKLRTYDPTLSIRVRVNSSRLVLSEFDRRDIDVAIVRESAKRKNESERLFSEHHGWYSSMHFRLHGKQLPLLTVTESCGLRETATKLLTEAGFDWIDSFMGGGIAAVINAVDAGLGIAPLPRRLASRRLIEIGPELGLPELPPVDVVMHANRLNPQSRDILRILTAAFRGSAQNNTNGARASYFLRRGLIKAPPAT
jgi:DNA-binding transcriptional LysR family regulator